MQFTWGQVASFIVFVWWNFGEAESAFHINRPLCVQGEKASRGMALVHNSRDVFMQEHLAPFRTPAREHIRWQDKNLNYKKK